MNKVRLSRLSLLVAGVASLCNVAMAQSVDQGRKFLYYHRYQSAIDVFNKVLASNPNDIEAIYWKGQALFDTKDSAAACDLYSKALQTNGNAPMLLAGMGGCELRMGKLQDARQRFETAISLTKGKDIPIFNAVAENNIEAPQGDAQYAIQKLSEATTVKHFNDAETYLLMGDAYRKLIDGGNAVTAYQRALSMDPKLAEAKYKIGRIYETQNNVEFFLPAFNDAIQIDPSYAPVYDALYIYYFDHGDLEKSKDNLDKYIANTDPSPQLDYDKTSYLYLEKKYDDAITASKTAISTLGDKADANYYKLIAYAYNDKGDSTDALNYLNQYFAKQKADQIIPNDYVFMGKVQQKFPEDSAASIQSYMKAINLDTSLNNKLQLIKQAADDAKAAGHKGAYAYWLGVQYPFLKDPNENDLYNWGFAYYSAGNYKTADSIFCGLYESKYPNEFFGYFWCKNCAIAMDDSVWSMGLPIEPYQKLAAWCRAADSVEKAKGGGDSTKYRRYIIESYSQLASYYNNVKKDKETAIAYLKQWQEVDPADPTPGKFIEILSRPARRPPAPAAHKTGARR